MELSLSNLQGTKRRGRKRVGRGSGSGRGTYAGRGLKGQRSRSGGKRNLRRRGLKQFLQQIPKSRGFKSPHPNFNAVNISALDKTFDAGAVVNPSRMKEAGLVKTTHHIVVLGGGIIKKKFSVQAHRFSKSAENAINKAGGKAEVIIIKKSVPQKSKLRSKK